MTNNRLTARELEITKRVANGKSNAEIAKEMFVSKDTVKTYLRRAFQKLGCTSRTGLAVRYAMDLTDDEQHSRWRQTKTAQTFMQGVAQLSAIEVRVLDVLADNPDEGNAGIAQRLGTSDDCIKQRLRMIAKKCSVQTPGRRAFLAMARRVTRGYSPATAMSSSTPSNEG